jgi:hypothetical protein
MDTSRLEKTINGLLKKGSFKKLIKDLVFVGYEGVTNSNFFKEKRKRMMNSKSKL